MINKTNKTILSVVLSAFVLFSCGKDDDTSNPTPTDPNNPANQKCQLTKATYTDPTGSESSTLEYNAAGRISKITSEEDGVVDRIMTIEYNAAGQVTKALEDDGEYETYEYNAAGLLVKKNQYYSSQPGAPVTLQYYNTYEYDSNNKLVKQSEYDVTPQGNQLYGYRTYTYPAANKVNKQGYRMTGSTATLDYTEETVFDDKKGPNTVLGVLAGTDALLSTHNVLMEKYTSVGSSTTYTTTYAYEYNADGYATKEIYTDNGVTDDGATVYTYNCN